MPMPGMPPGLGQGVVGMGPPPGPPPGAMEALGALQGQPSPGGEEDAIGQAVQAAGMALARAYLRSPEAATKISKAITLLNQAREDLQNAANQPMMPPPDMLAGQPPMGAPGGPRM